MELNEYHCSLVHRPGAKQVLSNALSRRDQDVPKDWNDDRLKAREKVLLLGDGELSVNVNAGWIVRADWDDDGETPDDTPTPGDISVAATPFSDSRLTELWKAALLANRRYWAIRRLVMAGEQSFPSTWGLAISMSECKIDGAGRLLWRDRVWIPAHEELRTAIIQRIHDSPLSGHPGRDLLRDMVAREYTWPNLTADIRRFIRNCDICNWSKIWREQTKGLLRPLPVPQRTWSKLSMDFVTDLPSSGGGCTNMLVVIDRLSKSVIVRPVQSMTAEAVAALLLQDVFAHHFLPDAIVSNHGPQFVSMVWKRVCDELKIIWRLSTAFHP